MIDPQHHNTKRGLVISTIFTVVGVVFLLLSAGPVQAQSFLEDTIGSLGESVGDSLLGSLNPLNRAVPVIDERHIRATEEQTDVNYGILEEAGEIAALLEKFVNKELEQDPLDNAQSVGVLAGRAQAMLESVRTGYEGYLAGAYPQDSVSGGGQSEGGSYAVRNLRSHLREVRGSEVDRLFDGDAGNYENDAPFSQQVEESVRADFANNPRNSSESFSLNYTMNEASNNPEGFIDGDWSAGGTGALLSLVSNPDNNVYGSYLQTQVEVNRRQREAEELEREQLNWSGGFHPQTNEDGDVLTPGVVNRQRLERSLDLCDEVLANLDEHGEAQEGADDVIAAIQERCNNINNQISEGELLTGEVEQELSGLESDMEGIQVTGQYNAEQSEVVSQSQDEGQDRAEDHAPSGGGLFGGGIFGDLAGGIFGDLLGGTLGDLLGGDLLDGLLGDVFGGALDGILNDVLGGVFDGVFDNILTDLGIEELLGDFDLNGILDSVGLDTLLNDLGLDLEEIGLGNLMDDLGVDWDALGVDWNAANLGDALTDLGIDTDDYDLQRLVEDHTEFSDVLDELDVTADEVDLSNFIRERNLGTDELNIANLLERRNIDPRDFRLEDLIESGVNIEDLGLDQHIDESVLENLTIQDLLRNQGTLGN